MNKMLCVVSCPIDTHSGYGARSRDFVKALYELKSQEWEIKVIAQRWGATPWGYIDDHKTEWGFLKDIITKDPQKDLANRQPEVWIQITIPNEFQPLGSKFNIGVTAGIETTVCDASWVEGVNRMSLTLVSSEHAKTVFQNSIFEVRNKTTNALEKMVKLEKPVEVLFEGVNLNTYFAMKDDDVPSTNLVDRLDEIEENFCFLMVGHWLQGELGEDRKNIGMTLKYFLETFRGPSKNKPALVMKVSGGAGSIIDREDMLKKIDHIRSMVMDKNDDLPKIYLIHGELEDEDINYLYNHEKIKCMISLTKGEGFGRPLLEFSVCEKPIIASNWSGHKDYMSEEFTVFIGGSLTNVHPSAQVANVLLAESQWFTVDEYSAKSSMKNVYMNYDKYKIMAKRQAYISKKDFGFDAMKHKMKEYLDMVPKNVNIILPKLKKIKL